MRSNYPWIKLIRVVWRLEEKVENLPSSAYAIHRSTKHGRENSVYKNERHSPKVYFVKNSNLRRSYCLRISRGFLKILLPQTGWPKPNSDSKLTKHFISGVIYEMFHILNCGFEIK